MRCELGRHFLDRFLVDRQGLLQQDQDQEISGGVGVGETGAPRVLLVLTHLLLALLMQQLPQVVQATGDGALVGVGVLQVLIGDVCAGGKGALCLVQVAPVHQDDSRVQVGR